MGRIAGELDKLRTGLVPRGGPPATGTPKPATDPRSALTPKAPKAPKTPPKREGSGKGTRFEALAAARATKQDDDEKYEHTSHAGHTKLDDDEKEKMREKVRA